MGSHPSTPVPKNFNVVLNLKLLKEYLTQYGDLEPNQPAHLCKKLQDHLKKGHTVHEIRDDPEILESWGVSRDKLPMFIQAIKACQVNQDLQPAHTSQVLNPSAQTPPVSLASANGREVELQPTMKVKQLVLEPENDSVVQRAPRAEALSSVSLVSSKNPTPLGSNKNLSLKERYWQERKLDLDLSDTSPQEFQTHFPQSAKSGFTVQPKKSIDESNTSQQQNCDPVVVMQNKGLWTSGEKSRPSSTHHGRPLPLDQVSGLTADSGPSTRNTLKEMYEEKNRVVAFHSSGQNTPDSLITPKGPSPDMSNDFSSASELSDEEGNEAPPVHVSGLELPLHRLSTVMETTHGSRQSNKSRVMQHSVRSRTHTAIKAASLSIDSDCPATFSEEVHPEEMQKKQDANEDVEPHSSEAGAMDETLLAGGKVPKSKLFPKLYDDARTDSPLTTCSNTDTAENSTERESLNSATDFADTGTATDNDNADERLPYQHRKAKKIRIKKGQWKMGNRIGRGAFGEVYKAMHLITGQLMAVKAMPIPRNSRHCHDLYNEISTMKKLDHPNIVRYLGAEMDRDDKRLYIFQEWVPGGSVVALLRTFGALEKRVVQMYTRQILEGLQYLHSHHIIHRDIKGDNLLVTDQGVVKLADFGASKRMDADGTMGVTHSTMKGTPWFMAPEVLVQDTYGRKADIWSVGGTVIQMTSGKPPWQESKCTTPIMLLQYMIKDPTRKPMYPENTGKDLEEFLDLCFQREPANRPNAKKLLQSTFVQNCIELDSCSSDEEDFEAGDKCVLNDIMLMRNITIIDEDNSDDGSSKQRRSKRERPAGWKARSQEEKSAPALRRPNPFAGRQKGPSAEQPLEGPKDGGETPTKPNPFAGRNKPTASNGGGGQRPNPYASRQKPTGGNPFAGRTRNAATGVLPKADDSNEKRNPFAGRKRGDIAGSNSTKPHGQSNPFAGRSRVRTADSARRDVPSNQFEIRTRASSAPRKVEVDTSDWPEWAKAKTAAVGPMPISGQKVSPTAPRHDNQSQHSKTTDQNMTSPSAKDISMKALNFSELLGQNSADQAHSSRSAHLQHSHRKSVNSKSPGSSRGISPPTARSKGKRFSMERLSSRESRKSSKPELIVITPRSPGRANLIHVGHDRRSSTRSSGSSMRRPPRKSDSQNSGKSPKNTSNRRKSKHTSPGDRQSSGSLHSKYQEQKSQRASDSGRQSSDAPAKNGRRKQPSDLSQRQHSDDSSGYGRVSRNMVRRMDSRHSTSSSRLGLLGNPEEHQRLVEKELSYKEQSQRRLYDSELSVHSRIKNPDGDRLLQDSLADSEVPDEVSNFRRHFENSRHQVVNSPINISTRGLRFLNFKNPFRSQSRSKKLVKQEGKSSERTSKKYKHRPKRNSFEEDSPIQRHQTPIKRFFGSKNQVAQKSRHSEISSISRCSSGHYSTSNKKNSCQITPSNYG